MTTLAAAQADAVAQLAPSPAARRDAELLLLHATGLSRAALLTHPDRELTAAQSADYRDAVKRRAQQEPIQYIMGVQEFFGRPFRVSPAVLIPRPETEHLVEVVLALRPAPQRILDVGTGSGILAITLALELPDAIVVATDISTAALVVARANAATLGAEKRIRFVESDLFASIAAQRFDCIVSNPPYVPSGEALAPQVSRYEPAFALFAGVDGLEIHRRLIPQAAAALEPGGHLLLEIGYGQRAVIEALLMASAFRQVRFVDDLQGIPRVALARAR